MIRGVDGVPDLGAVVDGRYGAVFVPGVGGERSTVLLAAPADLERIEVLRGPQGTLFGRNAVAGAIRLDAVPPLDCAGIEFEVDMTTSTLTASPAWCDEPVLVEIACPTLATVGETVQVDAVVSEAVEARVDWRLGAGLSLNAEYSDYRPGVAWGESIGASYTFDRPGDTEFVVTATNDYGTDTFTCPVTVRDAQADDVFDAPRARFGLGYNLEFDALTARLGGSAPLPVDLPLTVDLDIGVFRDDFDRDYLTLNAELSCGWTFDDLGLTAGAGLHTLRQSFNSNADWQIGPGATVRGYYDGGWPVVPIGEVSGSYLYETVIWTPTAGVSYRF